MYRLRSLEGLNMTSVSTPRRAANTRSTRHTRTPQRQPTGVVPEHTLGHHVIEYQRQTMQECVIVGPGILSAAQTLSVYEEDGWSFFPRPTFSDDLEFEREQTVESEEEDADVQVTSEAGGVVAGLVKMVKSYFGIRVG